MMTRLSAFPVRMSYNVNVRSEPTLARTLDSARLNRTLEMVSLLVGKVRLLIGADLDLRLVVVFGIRVRHEISEREMRMTLSSYWE